MRKMDVYFVEDKNYDIIKYDFSLLNGKTINKIEKVYGLTIPGESLLFYIDESEIYALGNTESACNDVGVYLDEVHGDLDDLIGYPIVEAEEVGSLAAPEHIMDDYTWTFYKLRTRKGFVTLRWRGESNGYYSEKVSFLRVLKAVPDS